MDNSPVSVPEKPAFQLPKQHKKRKRLIVLIVIAALAALVFFFVIRPIMTASQQLTGALYLPSVAEYRDLTVSVSGTATVLPVDSYKVTALVKGEILSAPFEEGDIVSKGDLLYTIDPGDLENTIARTVLSVQQAELSYRELLRTREDAQKNLDLTATADGIVEKLYIKVGDTVPAGSPIADILDRANMRLEVPFHSAVAADFYEGQPATITVDGTGSLLYGTVHSIAPTEQVGPGGTRVRTVTLSVSNPGALDSSHTGTAAVGPSACVAAGPFAYAAQKTVTAKTTGEVQSLSASEGDAVYDGQLLGRFKSTDMDAQIENARISLESAKLSLQNTRDQLENYQITSPISGTVIEKNFKTGDNLDATTSGYLAVLYDMSQLTFDIAIDELYMGKIELGQTVRMTAKAVEGGTFTGHVSKVNINGVTGGGVTNYPVTVVIDDAGALLPGMNVSAEIIVEDATNVLSIPVTAVGRGNTVQILPASAVDKDGVADYTKLVETPVTLGRNDAQYIEILSGVSEGDTVVTRQSATSMMEQMMQGMGPGMGPGISSTTVVAP